MFLSKMLYQLLPALLNTNPGKLDVIDETLAGDLTYFCFVQSPDWVT